MLRLLANQLYVYLSAERVTVIHRQGFLVKQTHSHHQVFASSAPNDWAQAIQILHAYLNEKNITASTSLTVYIGADLIRMMVLPAQSAAMTLADKQAYAQAAFIETYGEKVHAWRISVADTLTKYPTLVAATDEALLMALTELAAQYRLQLSAVLPYVVASYERLVSSYRYPRMSLVLVEHNRLTLMRVQAQVCDYIKIEKYQQDWQKTMQQLLARTALIYHETEAEVCIFAPLHPHEVLQTPLHAATHHNELATPMKRLTLGTISQSNAATALLEALV